MRSFLQRTLALCLATCVVFSSTSVIKVSANGDTSEDVLTFGLKRTSIYDSYIKQYKDVNDDVETVYIQGTDLVSESVTPLSDYEGRSNVGLIDQDQGR